MSRSQSSQRPTWQATAVGPPAGGRLDLGGHGLARVELAGGHDHVGARLGEGLDDRPPDAAGRAGDDGDLSREVLERGDVGHTTTITTFARQGTCFSAGPVPTQEHAPWPAPALRSPRSTSWPIGCSTSTPARSSSPATCWWRESASPPCRPGIGPRRRRGDRPRRPHPAARADGHGGQPADGRPRPRQPAGRGPGRPGRADPAGRGQRTAHAAGRVHDRAQPRAVRADRRDPARRRTEEGDRPGWIDGPRIVPAGHAISPTGGHLDPTMFQRLAPDVLPLTVEEGIADGVDEVRKAVRYQIKYGAQLIKVCASGGVMSHTGPAGAQQYSDEELRAIVDEAHRAGLEGRRPLPRRRRPSAPPSSAGIDCIEHGSLMSDETMDADDRATARSWWPPPTSPTAWTCRSADPELQAKAAEVFPQAKATIISKAIDRGRARSRAAPTRPPSPTAATPRSWSRWSTGA